MNEEPNPNPEPNKLESAGVTMLWLILGFVPSMVGILVIDKASQTVLVALMCLAGVCCFASAFGILRRIKDLVARICLSIFLAGALAFLDLIIVVFVGCSRMGPM